MVDLKNIKNYTPVGIIRLAKDYALTKVFYGNARIIRFPFYIRGAKRIDVGKGMTGGVGIRIDAFGDKSRIKIGENVRIGDYCHIAAMTEMIIGKNTALASRVYITDHNHGLFDNSEMHSKPEELHSNRKMYVNKVVIGENVWIGEGAIILKSVHVGDNCVIAAGSVVTKSIEMNTIVGGVPARPIKKYCYSNLGWVKV